MHIFNKAIENDILRVTIGHTQKEGQSQYFLSAIDVKYRQEWKLLLSGLDNGEFSTSLEQADALSCRISETGLGETNIILEGESDYWSAREVLTLPAKGPVLRRMQTYRFKKDCSGAVYPGFLLPMDDNLRYTYAVQVHEKNLSEVPALRKPTDWAVPFPFHVWHNDGWVGMYGLNKSISAGTIEFLPQYAGGKVVLRTYYPDTLAPEMELVLGKDLQLDEKEFHEGEEISLHEIIAVKILDPDDEPLLEAERIAADILLREPFPPVDLKGVSDRIGAFYPRCQLWEVDALGPGRGWFSNMWVRTQTGPAKKLGEASGFFDLGWGEGIAVEMWLGAVRYWRRTGKTELLVYVDEMTRNMDLFRRDPGSDVPYYDRSDGQHFGDFILFLSSDATGQRIWTHSLGHIGSQLIQLYQDSAGYPNPEVRDQWLSAIVSIAGFFAKHQQENGDLPDILDEQDHEVNTKAHRIAARAVVCGLWTRLGVLTGEKSWVERSLHLANAVTPEITRYDYYNQMIDNFMETSFEAVDAEAAYYVLEGLVPLYEVTRDPCILVLCKKAAAFGIAWTYFYNLPNAYRGISRGGQCCRTDIPLLYPIGSTKGIGPLLGLAKATGDSFYEKMAKEMIAFISRWQIHAPDLPWDGGMLHAMVQFNGKHWGPDQTGQVDTGMATGNSLANIELWLESTKKQKIT
jgi:hypothetical protein